MIPDSVWAEAKRRDVSAVDFWLSLTETLRDTLHQRALNEGATRVGITQAQEEVRDFGVLLRVSREAASRTTWFGWPSHELHEAHAERS
jgi:hypothetical protein